MTLSPRPSPSPTRPRARIVCTLGPASVGYETLRRLVDAGMDVARLNFSHGTRAQHQTVARGVRAAAGAAGRTVALLADLQGPKIRFGTFEGGSVRLETGAEFTVTTEPVVGTASVGSTSYADLASDVRAGSTLLVDDGLVRLEVLATDGKNVRCRVVEGGPVSDHKGINLPGVRVSAPALTDKDREDLAFALSIGVDLVTLSFVRSADDARVVREAMRAAGREVPVLAKFEKPEAVERLESIIDAFDGLMVARGDLGVEIPLEQVPLQQKRAIRLCRVRARPVIVATQMLESMIEHARPTRAEASDVANAVLDGADAMMLSAETSVGRYPVEATDTMRRLILATEAGRDAESAGAGPPPSDVSSAVARAAVGTAREIGARALAAFTRTGATARQIAAYRPDVATFAFASDAAVLRRLAVTWGVEPICVPDVATTEAMVTQVDRALREAGFAAPGDRVVIVAGAPSGSPGSTNLMRVHRIGDPVSAGA